MPRTPSVVIVLVEERIPGARPYGERGKEEYGHQGTIFLAHIYRIVKTLAFITTQRVH
jgi:hypothetical protein